MSDQKREALTSLGLLILRVGSGAMMIYGHGLSKLTNFGEISKKFPDPVLNGLGQLSGEVIADLAAADPLSREVMESLAKFRAQSIPYAKVSEQAFYNARGLPFKWVQL